MQIFHNSSIPKNYKGCALAIGNFDGVHKGHQTVFKNAKKFAKKDKIKFGVLTFTPLPVMFFNKTLRTKCNQCTNRIRTLDMTIIIYFNYSW